MESNSLFPLKYRLRKTDEPVEIVAWETVEKGARNENDWVSYIDAQGNEHIKEHLTLEWDFIIQTPFEKGFLDAFKTDLPKFDLWEARRYELVKEMYFRKSDFDVALLGYDGLVQRADELIAALKPKEEDGEVVEGVQMDDGYENIGIGEIVATESDDGTEIFKKFIFTDRKDIVGYEGDSGRWKVGDRVKVYIKRFDPQDVIRKMG